MKTAAFLGLIMIVSGCAMLDGKQVRWQRVSAQELKNLCPHAESPIGCALWYRNNNDCYVYTLATLEPNSAREQLVVGHEVLHCFNGNFHK